MGFVVRNNFIKGADCNKLNSCPPVPCRCVLGQWLRKGIGMVFIQTTTKNARRIRIVYDMRHLLVQQLLAMALHGIPFPKLNVSSPMGICHSDSCGHGHATLTPTRRPPSQSTVYLIQSMMIIIMMGVPKFDVLSLCRTTEYLQCKNEGFPGRLRSWAVCWWVVTRKVSW